MQEMKTKDKALTASQTNLSKNKFILTKVSQMMDSLCKMMDKLNLSPSKARERWKKAEDSL